MDPREDIKEVVATASDQSVARSLVVDIKTGVKAHEWDTSSGGSKITGSRNRGTGCKQSSSGFPCEMTLSPDDSCDDDVLDYKSLTTGHEPFCFLFLSQSLVTQPILSRS